MIQCFFEDLFQGSSEKLTMGDNCCTYSLEKLASIGIEAPRLYGSNQDTGILTDPRDYIIEGSASEPTPADHKRRERKYKVIQHLQKAKSDIDLYTATVFVSEADSISKISSSVVDLSKTINSIVSQNEKYLHQKYFKRLVAYAMHKKSNNPTTALLKRKIQSEKVKEDLFQGLFDGYEE